MAEHRSAEPLRGDAKTRALFLQAVDPATEGPEAERFLLIWLRRVREDEVPLDYLPREELDALRARAGGGAPTGDGVASDFAGLDPDTVGTKVASAVRTVQGIGAVLGGLADLAGFSGEVEGKGATKGRRARR